MQGADGSLLDSYRVSRSAKDRSVGTWNVDGEVLRQHSLSLRYVNLKMSQRGSIEFSTACMHDWLLSCQIACVK